MTSQERIEQHLKPVRKYFQMRPRFDEIFKIGPKGPIILRYERAHPCELLTDAELLQIFPFKKVVHGRASSRSNTHYSLAAIFEFSNNRGDALASRQITKHARCDFESVAGIPIAFPSAFARAMPAFVRSINKSRWNSATAFSTCIVIHPAALMRSTPLTARQCTRMPRAARASTVSRTSIALQPCRSSFVTTNTPPSSIRSTGFANPGRRAAPPLLRCPQRSSAACRS